MDYCEQNEMEKAISHICNCEYEYFLNKANVVGIGCGYKVTKGFHTNQLCIQVFTKRKLSKSQLNSQDLVPNLYKGFLTDVTETGVFTSCSFRKKIRPVIGGYCIGIDYNSEITGTLGCLVTDGYDNYILSCNHILANMNNAPIGTRVIQPSFRYGGKPSIDIIAILSKFIPIKFKGILTSPTNYADCAIAKVINNSLVSPKVALIGNIQGTIIPRLNKEVKKVGERTELTTGKITSISGTISVNCSFLGKVALFKNQVITTLMSEGGDSGSMLVDKNNNAIGLLISGSKTHDTFSPIEYILKSLNINIVT